ncbi:MAG: FAD-dependent oxidoreductase, partial [Nanoarchaeota archaeon]
MTKNNFDVIIVGAGGVGLAAAMYSARLGMKTLVLGATHGSELPVGGVITTTNIVENYPGFIKLTGQELAKKIEEHAKSYELVKIKEEKVIDVKKIKNCFSVKTEKSEYKSLAIIFATGTKWKKLDVPGSKEFENKGINYCALC